MVIILLAFIKHAACVVLLPVFPATVLCISISSPPLQEDRVIPHRVRAGNYSTLYSKRFYSKQSKLDGRGWKLIIQVRDYFKLKPVLLANLWSNVCSIQMQWTVAYFVESKIG